MKTLEGLQGRNLEGAVIVEHQTFGREPVHGHIESAAVEGHGLRHALAELPQGWEIIRSNHLLPRAQMGVLRGRRRGDQPAPPLRQRRRRGVRCSLAKRRPVHHHPQGATLALAP